jgi:hypothetical protein
MKVIRISELLSSLNRCIKMRGSSSRNYHFKEVEMKTTWKDLLVAIGVVFGVLLMINPVMAATNQADDPGGGVTSLGISNTVTITSLAALALVKEARLLDGTVLGASTNIAAGTTVYFVIYVDNTSGIPLVDTRIIDDIDTAAGGFTPVAGTFAILNNVGTGIDMSAANIINWTTPANWLLLTWDLQDETLAGAGDYLDYGQTAGDRVTIGAAANDQLDVPISLEAVPATNPHRTAFRFQATINP